jgi:hypothetical protein
MTGENTRDTKPLFQRLSHLDKFTFNGDVNIHLKVCFEFDLLKFFFFEFNLD